MVAERVEAAVSEINRAIHGKVVHCVAEVVVLCGVDNASGKRRDDKPEVANFGVLDQSFKVANDFATVFSFIPSAC